LDHVTTYIRDMAIQSPKTAKKLILSILTSTDYPQKLRVFRWKTAISSGNMLYNVPK